MSSPDRLGQVAYEAWCSKTASPLSLWQSLPENVREAWNYVGQSVLLAVGEKSGPSEDEPEPAA